MSVAKGLPVHRLATHVNETHRYLVSKCTLGMPPPALPQAPINGLEHVAQLSLLNVDARNHLYRGDCLSVLAPTPDESVDLVYIAPPFYSQRYYETFWEEDAERFAFEDRWKGGKETYLNYLVERVRKMHAKLKPTGLMFMHLDWHICHYMKVEMDRIFGYERFRNEIAWRRTPFSGSSKARAQQLPRSHDTIFLYSKGDEWHWNMPTLPYTQEYKRRFKWKDERGYYRKTLLKTYSEQTLGRLKRDGRLVLPTRAGANYSYKQYLHESSGTRQVDDVWTDINMINPVARERTGYPTQKPMALLNRIIQMASNKGDVVLDAFCGCGTTLESSEANGRRWIGIDISQQALRVVQNRLRKIGSPRCEVHGMIELESDLQGLDWREFQMWAVEAVQGRHSPRKIADMGIDGFTFMENHPIQVKQSDSVGRPVIDNFVGVLERQKDKRGLIIAFDFTRGAEAEVARLRRESNIQIELIPCKRLLRDEIPYRQLA